MNEVAIYNKTDEEFPYEEIIEKVVNKAFEVEGVKKASCSIIIVDNTFIHKDDKSMIIPDDIRLLGDIYICLDKAREQAKEYGHSLERELCFLAVHGVYHLLGYDHENEEEAKIMFKKQEEVLMEYGITR